MSSNYAWRGIGAALFLLFVATIVIAAQLAGRASTAALHRPTAQVSPSPSRSGSMATAAPAPTPTAPSAPRETTTPRDPFVDDAGFWVDGASAFHRVHGVYQTDECAADLCFQAVEVITGAARSGVRINLAAGVMPTIRGATLEEIGRSLAAAFPKEPPEQVWIDGLPALRVDDERSNASWAFTIVGGRLYVFRAPNFFAPTGWANLRTFTWDLHFFAPPCWMTPCPSGVVAAAHEPLLAFDADRAGTSWTARLPSIRSDPLGDASMRQFAWSCDAGCDGSLRVSVGTTITGPLVAPTGAGSIRLPGADVDAVRAAWMKADPNASFTPMSVAGKPAVMAADGYRSRTVLFIHRGYVVAITADGWLRLDPAAGYIIERFLAGLTLLD